MKQFTKWGINASCVLRARPAAGEGGEAAAGPGLCGVGAQKGGKGKKAFKSFLDGGGQGFLIIWGLGDGARRRLRLMEILNSRIPTLLLAEETGN